MTDIYGVMSLAGNALLAHQKAINVTGNNIANVNTPGYSRQKLLLETREPVQSSIGLMGNGLEADSVERVYDRFLGVQINSESETLGRWAARKDGLGIAEVIFDESGEFGLSQSLNQFWSSWQNLANDPSGYNERVVLQAKSEVMTGNFNRLYSDLQNARQGFDANIEGAVADINRMSQQIAELNQKIMEVEASGTTTANDYRDRRDLVLKELAGLIDINTFEDGTGRVTVSVGSGQTLVESNSSRDLNTQINGFGFKDVAWVGQDGTTVNITGDINNGRLNGWLQTRDVDIRGYLRQLDVLAESLMARVNSLHQNGWGLDGSNGNDFFTGIATASGNLDSLLTITAEPGGTGNINVTLVGGGPAIPSVTTDSVTGDILIAIQDGVTTGGQIATALQAHSGINSVVAAAPGAAWDLSIGTNTAALGGGSSAEAIQVNAAIINDLDLIAASATSAGIPGNNGQAIAIADLQHSLTMNGNSSTFEDYFNSLVSKVGGDMQNAEAYFNHQSDMVVQLDNRRESISGVSLDEEMINLVKFQTAYDAAAKLITTADELLQTVLNLV